MTNITEEMKQLAHQIHGLSIRIDQEQRQADDLADASARAQHQESANEFLEDLQVAAHDLADKVLGLG